MDEEGMCEAKDRDIERVRGRGREADYNSCYLT